MTAEMDCWHSSECIFLTDGIDATAIAADTNYGLTLIKG